MYEPSGDDLNTALDIIEGVLAAIYVHSNAATALSVECLLGGEQKVIPWKDTYAANLFLRMRANRPTNRTSAPNQEAA